MVRRWNPAEVAPPVGRYSHLATAPAGSQLVFFSGQVGVLPDGALAGRDAESQTRQILANLELLLSSLGAGPQHLMKLTTFLAGTEHLDGCRAAMKAAFEAWFPDGDWPAQTLVVVAALAAPELAVEIEAVAAVPRR